MKLEFSEQFFAKCAQIYNFMKMCQVEPELFHAVGRLDDEADSRFSQFCERA